MCLCFVSVFRIWQQLYAIYLTSDKPHYPFELPKGWVWTTVGETCETHLGKMLDKLKNEGCYMSYLRNINVRWGCFDLTDVLKMRFKDDEVERYMIEKGDLVLCEGGEPGRCAIWDKANPIMFQKALHRIRCHGGVLNEYLKYVIEDYAKANKLEEYYTGSTIKHLTGESLVSILFPLPPIKEQERIVQEIQRYLSLVAIIENNKENLLAAIKQAKSKVLDLAIHGKLVPQDPNDEPASELLKRINPKAEITCDTPQYGKLPKGWCETTLGNTIVIKSGDAIKVRDNRIGKYPIYGGNGITGYNESYNVDGINIIIGRVGFYCGSVHYVNNKIWVTDNAFVTKIMGNVYTPKFLYYLLQQYDLKQYSNSTAQPVISGKTVYPINVMLPPLSEQYRIVARIEELFAQLDKIESSLQA